ncbi:phosphate acyltransferase [Agrilactobacillus fermenti]|uniref:phosphate acyltransferase n=1 Tax=Agrilactobacillus fermenti TaxID=2586909 RepID=UPI001E56A001|nr:phosphate acyltransferase [Agrilactobacillus fermenti]MCD2257004.1 phosphotransacetylase [Agrilactobacillus fermenti]
MITIAVAGGNHTEIIDLLQQMSQTNDLIAEIFDTGQFLASESATCHYHRADSLKAAVAQCVAFVAEGEADILFKGIVQTHTLLHAVLQYPKQMLQRSILSHVAQLSFPEGRQLLLSDAGMNIAPNLDQYIAIIENTRATALNIGIQRPKIALLSAAENFNPKMPSSVLAHEATQQFAADPTATVFGPISLDLALSKSAVAKKQFSGPIVGDADAIVVPNIDTGNALYKALMLFTDIQTGGVIVGARVPIVLTSRSDRIESKRASLKFALNTLNHKR